MTVYENRYSPPAPPLFSSLIVFQMRKFGLDVTDLAQVTELKSGSDLRLPTKALYQCLMRRVCVFMRLYYIRCSATCFLFH